MFRVLHLQAVSNPMWWGEEMGNSFLSSFCFSQLLAPDISVFTSSRNVKISELIRVDKTWEGGEHESRKRIIRGQCPEQNQLTAQLYTASDNASQLHWLGGKLWAGKYWPSAITELLYHASKLYDAYQNCTCKWLQTILVLYCVSI